jgi:hypothetical protein
VSFLITEHSGAQLHQLIGEVQTLVGQERLDATIPYIHVNQDNKLLDVLEPLGIPIRLSVYSVIRQLALELGDPALVSVIVEAVNCAVHSPETTWEESILDSSVGHSHPQLCDIIIALLRRGPCDSRWLPKWIPGTAIQNDTIQWSGYNDRLLIELRKGLM